jgi:hypothetical protein
VTRRLLVLGILVFASLAAITLALLRDAAAGNVDFWFLIWNLCLAWIPFLLALGAYGYARRASSTIALGFGWLLFFPNAPYIVTDFVHLQRGAPVPLWYDALTIGAFAGVGLALGFASSAEHSYRQAISIDRDFALSKTALDNLEGSGILGRLWSGVRGFLRRR